MYSSVWYLWGMKPTAVLGLVLLCTACNDTAEENTLKAQRDSVRREYEEARQQLLLKKDSAKIKDMSLDADFLYRLKAAEDRVVRLKQEVEEKKDELRTQKKAHNTEHPSPATQ